ncbi:MAG: hypothetical protein CVT48_05160 [Thermoplasmata archaeon HGW-Thermoplasmata-1]|nr:MAG: hypothetical protein CVT48_05160 [Thermoplasmata archaeon HGW-Thermoplasmata-1]
MSGKSGAVHVVDSSFILSGKPVSGEFEAVTVPRVLDEFRPGGVQHRKLEFMLEMGMRVFEPCKASTEAVREAARKTGDSGRLSDTDVELVALAAELVSGVGADGGCGTCGAGGCEKRDVVVVTDDYSIQNICRALGIDFQPISQGGITQQRHWIYRCAGCGRYFKEEQKADICPVCGSAVRSAAKRKR